MGRLFRLVMGLWSKSSNGDWSFQETGSGHDESLIINRNDSFEGVLERIRIMVDLGILTPVALTYQLPDWMLEPEGPKTPPITLLCDKDVEIMSTVSDYMYDPVLYVTSGPEQVAKYQFYCRSPFKIDETTYLEDGVTEDEHRQAIRDLVGGHPIVCSHHILELMYNEPQLLLVYRVALEIEMVYGVPNDHEETEDPGEFLNLTGEENMATDEGVSIPLLHPANDDPNIQVLHGEPITIEQVEYAFINNSSPLDVEPLNVWRESTPDDANWDAMMDNEDGYEVYLSQPPHPTEGVLGLQVAPNKRVSAPQPTTIIINDDSEGSYTGSSEGLNDSVNVTNPGTEDDVEPVSTLMIGDSSAAVGKEKTTSADEVVVATDPSVTPTNTEPCLDLTLGIGLEKKMTAKVPISGLDDASSEAEAGIGNGANKSSELYEGKIFSSRAEFKQHMALYALRHKFRFKNSRSSTDGMVLRCISLRCNWRVYAIKMKNVDKYEIRKLILEHTCSVDDRTGYEEQATHSVVGELMKARFAGKGCGPRPNEIIQVMLSDHNIRISYWKAWRSREFALQYAKGSFNTSYKLLPEYLQKLVVANPGTIAEMHTVHDANVGHRFKYMFLALGACITGLKQMRNVIIIDGAHLRGKYAGCLLSASAQDGNYQVFPIAVAIVDGENDNAWEWFFKMLLQFIPNNNDLVFVSDRHSSIYNGISKVYPAAKHCACILHLQRNITTHYKNKHLSYLVGKAARAFQLGEFYNAFNEIKNINASCAEYLTSIGFEHWARAHFSGNRYNIMTSNVAETWNSVLREAREYPIVALVEFIRSKLMDWYAERRNVTLEGNGRLTPRVKDIIETNFDRSGGLIVSRINNDEYEVKEMNGSSFHVNLVKRSCSCYSFQMLLIPCHHAIAAAIKDKVTIESLVSEFYTLKTLAAGYAEDIVPITDDVNNCGITVDGQEEPLLIFPPASRRPPGRPRKSRILSTGEMRMKTPRRRHLCSRCKGKGHNKATCKVPI